MFALASLRTGARAFTAPALTRTGGFTPGWVPSKLTPTLTRSFVTSVVRAGPASAELKTAAKTSKKKATLKTAKKTAKAEEKAGEKKPVKKAKKFIVPKSIKIPPVGMTAFAYYLTKVYQTELPRSQENIGSITKAASVEWRALPESEKQKYTDISRPLRAKAQAERQAYINSINPIVLREINRRRLAKGKKTRLHQTREGYIPTAYVRWLKEYLASHPDALRDTIAKSMPSVAKVWRGMSAEEKQPYVDQHNAEMAEKNARKEV